MKRRSSKLSPLPQKMQNSDEKYLTVLETANRTAGEEVVNIWLSSWETNSANICYVLQAVVIIIFKDMYCCLSVDVSKPFYLLKIKQFYI